MAPVRIISTQASQAVTFPCSAHGDAGPGVDGHRPGPPDRGQQVGQVRLVQAGQVRGVGQRERLDGAGQLVAGRVVEHVAAGALGQELADDVGQHRVVGAGPGGHVAGGQPGRLGPQRVQDPDLGVLPHVRIAVTGSDRAMLWPWETTGFTPM